jgi:nucleoside-diphosphate-sugar epimerase
MKAFVTGATGFLGSRIAALLRARGDDVVVLVRSREKASTLEDIGCDLVIGDLADEPAIERATKGCDSVFHVAAIYEVGIPKSRRPAMFDANVRGTQRVLDAAIDAGATRIVYVSTVNVFGNTRGDVVDETYERPGDDFLSYYDETKFLAHQIAKERIAAGAPIVIAQPSLIYGPGDHSEVGHIIRQSMRGKQLYIPFPNMGFSSVHVDDAAQGVLLAHDKGAIGESYVLAGEITTMRDVIEKAAAAGGEKPPRLVMPTLLTKMSAPLGPLLARPMKLPANMREVIRASDGVTYWAKDDKARDELGYSPRNLATGLRELNA